VSRGPKRVPGRPPPSELEPRAQLHDAVGRDAEEVRAQPTRFTTIQTAKNTDYQMMNFQLPTTAATLIATRSRGFGVSR
jgi:hypothetical protein